MQFKGIAESNMERKARAILAREGHAAMEVLGACIVLHVHFFANQFETKFGYLAQRLQMRNGYLTQLT